MLHVLRISYGITIVIQESLKQKNGSSGSKFSKLLAKQSTKSITNSNPNTEKIPNINKLKIKDLGKNLGPTEKGFFYSL